MRKSLMVLILAAGFALAAATPPDGGRAGVHRLANGLPVILLENHANPLTATFFVVKTGLRAENAGNCGLSHMLEHLLFNGTERFDQKQLYAELDFLGVYHNAFTRDDYTCYVMLSERDLFPRALDLQAQMLFHSTLPPDKVEKERGIILEELAKDSASPDFALERAAAEAVFAGTPYALPILGTPATLRDISRDALLAYYREQYVPNNMTLLVVGDFAPAEMLRHLEARLGKYPARPLPEGPRPVDLFTDPSVKVLPVESPAGRLLLTFPAPSPADPAWPAHELARRRLADDRTSPLAALLKAEGLGEYTLSALDNRDYSLCQLAVEVPAGRKLTPGQVATLREKIAALRTDFTDADLAGALTRLEAEEVFGQENIHYFGMLKGGLLADLPADQAAGFVGPRLVERFRSVTAAGVRAQAERILHPGKLRVAILEAAAAASPARPAPPAGMPRAMGGK
ncbi:MAG: insulinase family protein [Acidobacteria bacterium]|nr:insulinase family protein [Acidobacteriota bacterium]